MRRHTLTLRHRAENRGHDVDRDASAIRPHGYLQDYLQEDIMEMAGIDGTLQYDILWHGNADNAVRPDAHVGRERSVIRGRLVIVVDEKLASSVLCSTVDSEALHLPPRVDARQMAQPGQAFDGDVGAQCCHRFARAPQNLWHIHCGSGEGFPHHVLKLPLGRVIELVAQIAHFIQDDSEEFRTTAMNRTCLEQLRYKPD